MFVLMVMRCLQEDYTPFVVVCIFVSFLLCVVFKISDRISHYSHSSSLIITMTTTHAAFDANCIAFTNLMYIPMPPLSSREQDIDDDGHQPSWCRRDYQSRLAPRFAEDFLSSGPFTIFPSPGEELEEGDWDDVKSTMEEDHGLALFTTQGGGTIANLSADNSNGYFTIFTARLGCLGGRMMLQSCERAGGPAGEKGSIATKLGVALAVGDTNEIPSIRVCVSLFKIPISCLALPMNFDQSTSASVREKRLDELVKMLRNYSDTGDDDANGLPQLPRWMRALIPDSQHDGYRVLSYVVLKHSFQCLAPARVFPKCASLFLPTIACRSITRPHFVPQRLGDSESGPHSSFRVSLGLKNAKCIKWNSLEYLGTTQDIRFRVQKQLLVLDESLSEDECDALLDALRSHMTPVIIVLRVQQEQRHLCDELMSILMQSCDRGGVAMSSTARSTASFVSHRSVPIVDLRGQREEFIPEEAAASAAVDSSTEAAAVDSTEAAAMTDPRVMDVPHATPTLLTAAEAQEVMDTKGGEAFRLFNKKRRLEEAPVANMLREVNQRVEFYSQDEIGSSLGVMNTTTVAPLLERPLFEAIGSKRPRAVPSIDITRSHGPPSQMEKLRGMPEMIFSRSVGLSDRKEVDLYSHPQVACQMCRKHNHKLAQLSIKIDELKSILDGFHPNSIEVMAHRLP